MNNYGFSLFTIVTMWVYPRIYFHPTVPLPHMVPLTPLKSTMPYISYVCLLSIIAHDIKPAAHEKISQYHYVLAINQESRWLEDNINKVLNNFKSLYNAD